MARTLGDAVADVIDRVVAGHLLLLQEIGGVALAFGEDRDQHIGAGDLLAAGGLHVDHGALDHALEARGGLGILVQFRDQIVELVVDIADQTLAQSVEIDRTGAHDGGGFRVVQQAQQEMFERRIFVPALGSGGKSAMEGLFEVARE